MKRLPVGTTKDGKSVYVDTVRSHAATHLADTPGLLELVKELIPQVTADRSNIYLDHDFGREVGVSDLVTTSEQDKILYAKRPNRNNYTRFALHRKPEPTSFVSIVLHKDPAGGYELWSAWVGRAVPPFPGDKYETADSVLFWRTHALAWGNQKIQPGTERTDWPWGECNQSGRPNAAPKMSRC